jgi:hypothetical protein
MSLNAVGIYRFIAICHKPMTIPPDDRSDSAVAHLAKVARRRRQDRVAERRADEILAPAPRERASAGRRRAALYIAQLIQPTSEGFSIILPTNEGGRVEALENLRILNMSVRLEKNQSEIKLENGDIGHLKRQGVKGEVFEEGLGF